MLLSRLPDLEGPPVEGACFTEVACFTCRRVSVDCLTWVSITGELDVSSVPAISDALRLPFGAFPLLVLVDMRGVTFLDASATHVLLDAAAAISRQGGRLTIVRGAVPFDWWFSVVGIDQQLEVVDARSDGARNAPSGTASTRPIERATCQPTSSSPPA